jgi:hypothetical protein
MLILGHYFSRVIESHGDTRLSYRMIKFSDEQAIVIIAAGNIIV